MIFATSSSFSTTLLASDLSYNHLQAEILIADNDDEVELDNIFAIEGNYKIMDQVFITGGIATGSGTIKDKIEDLNIDLEIDADVDNYYFGAGYIHPLNDDWDANLIIGYSRTEFDGRTTARGLTIDISSEDSGIFISGGVRGKLNPKIELSALLEYSNDDDSSDTSISLSGHYYLMENVSAGLSTDFDSDSAAFFAVARVYF